MPASDKNLFGLGYTQDIFASLKRRRKPGSKFKYFLPLVLGGINKLAHLLPVAKLTLLALFALVLFAKKAFLVSIGSFALVMYDSFMKGRKKFSLMKDRGGTSSVENGYPLYPHDLYHEQRLHSWLGRLENFPTKTLHIYPEEQEEGKWKRWWTPQIKDHKLRKTSAFNSTREKELFQQYLLKKLNLMMPNIPHNSNEQVE